MRTKKKIEVKVRLSDRQKKEIEQLLMECESKEQRKLDFFMEQEWNESSDCPCFFLLYEQEREQEQKQKLVCVVSAFIIEREAELSAITQVERRKKGLFSKLIDVVFSVFVQYGIQKVSIRIEEKNDLGRQILEHWGWRKGQTDCLMVLLPEQIEKLCQLEEVIEEKENRGWEKEVRCFKDAEIIQKRKELMEVHASAFGCSWEESGWIFETNFSEGMKLWGYWIGDRVVGICFVMETGKNYFLSAVSIRREEQHQGHGEWFLRKVVIQLWERKKKEIFLQIFGENDRAIRLYQKLGFSFKQRLDTYFWELE